MKHKPDQAFEHREVFCFFLAFFLAAPSSYRVDRGRHLASSTFVGHRHVLALGFQAGAVVDFIHWRVAAERHGRAGDNFL
jgi:hypothetical protein